MKGPTHRCFGFLSGVTYATAAGQPPSMVLMSGIVATASSHGWLSPDVDQTRPWVLARKILPDSCDQLLNHRALSHWWGLPVLAWWGISHMPADEAWVATVLLVGWVSHLVGDFVFGTLPLLPWGGPRLGLGLKTGGFLESGKAKVRGKVRPVIPFGPVRVGIAALTVWVLLAGSGNLPGGFPA